MAYKATIAFGLVNIPVKAEPAARPARISFNMLCGSCKGRLNQKLWCGSCESEVARGNTLKGYEYSEGRYLIVTKEELDACEPESSKVFEIETVVSAEEVDPLLFESSYFLQPEPAGRKGYKLLLEALQAEGSYAIARATMSGREHVIIIRPFYGVLAFHTMFFTGEVRATPSLGLDSIQVKDVELALARQLLQANAAPFEHAAYADGYREKVEQLLQAKQEGQPIPITVKKPAARETGDLLAALTASLNQGNTKEAEAKPARKRKSA